MSRRLVVVLIAAAVLAGALRGHAQTTRLTIAAAADLQTVLPELVSRFERETGVKATVTFGSSGTFFAQIQNGAPFDLFFSADIDYPRRLGASGHGDAVTLYPYATGRIVLWTRKDSGVDVTRGLRVLGDAKVRRIAIANPLHAPYGRAAVAALRAGGLYETATSKLVLGENISQTAQLADSGNADAAIIALSLALGPALLKSGVYSEIPAAAHPPIEQAAIVVSRSTNKDAARRFFAFMKGSDVQATLRRFGFAATPGPVR
jgi:molybdate transport system substrate-binding protein